VLKVARGVLEQLDTEQVLERVLDAAREVTGARYAALGVLNQPRSALARFLSRGIDDHDRRAPGEGFWASSSATRARCGWPMSAATRTPMALRLAIHR
jgi:hypothetical protein